MARPMYALLTTTPFRVPIDPGPIAIYYPPPVAILDVDSNLALDALGCAFRFLFRFLGDRNLEQDSSSGPDSGGI
jgi:hypothetical protein